MEYIEEKNFAISTKKIISNFFSYKNNAVGIIERSDESEQNDAGFNRHVVFGKSFDKNLFEERKSLDTGYSFRNFEKIDENPFIFNELKSKFFSSFIERIEDQSRIHFFGDIFTFDYHYVQSKEIENIMFNCVNERYPTIKKEDNILNICLESVFKNEKPVIDFLKKQKYYFFKNISKKNVQNFKKTMCNDFKKNSFNYIKNNEKYILNKNSEFSSLKHIYVKNLSRFFCLGCFCGKNKTTNYAMTIINNQDKVKVFITNNFFIEKIQKIYNEMGGDENFESIENFFTKYDFFVKKTSKENFDIEPIKTKYLDLEGSIVVPSIEYFVTNIAIDQLSFLNKFNDNVSEYFNVEKKYFPLDVINIKDGEITFRNLNSDFYFKKIFFKKEIFDDDEFNFNQLEI